MFSANERAEIFAHWLTALRSNEFEQGQGTLHKGNQYCCLGVLCELETRRDRMTDWPMFGTWQYNYLGAVSRTALPDHYAAELGISAYGDFRIGPIDSNLIELNDFGFSFPMIADVIEYVERYGLWTSVF